MHSVFLNLGFLTIHWYGVMMAMGFFAGLTMRQASFVLGISLATAERDWVYAKAWLHERVTHDEFSSES